MPYLGSIFTIEGTEQTTPPGAAGPLSQVLCTEGECTLGAALISQMVEVFNALGAPKEFREAVEAVRKPYYTLESVWGRKFLPVHPVCCQIKDLGLQAQRITGQMLAAAPAAALVPRAPAPMSFFERAFKAATILGAVATVLYLLFGIYKFQKEQQPRRRIRGRALR
jgi:hypothetical protein